MGVMDFLFSGNAPSTFTQASEERTDLPAWYQDASKALITKASQYANAAEPIYQGPRLAELTPEQQQAFTQTQQVNGRSDPYMQQGLNTSQRLGQGFDPNEFNKYMSSYTDNVTDVIANLGVRNLREKILPGVQDDFITSGQFGSRQQGNVMNKALRDSNESILNQQTMALQDAQKSAMGDYLSGQQNAQTAANSLMTGAGQYQTMGLEGANALYNTGAIKQNQNQQGLNIAYNDFQNQSQEPLRDIGLLSSVIRGQQLPTQSTSYTPQLSGAQNTGSTDILSLLQALSSGTTKKAKGGLVGYAEGGKVDGDAAIDELMKRYGVSRGAPAPRRINTPRQGQSATAPPPGMFTPEMVQSLLMDPTYVAQMDKMKRDLETNKQLAKMFNYEPVDVRRGNLDQRRFADGGQVPMTAEDLAAALNQEDGGNSLPPLPVYNADDVLGALKQMYAPPSPQTAASQSTRLPHVAQSLDILQQMAQQAPQQQQKASQSRLDYAEQLKKLTNDYLAAQQQMSPYLGSEYEGLVNPENIMQQADDYAKTFKDSPGAQGMAYALRNFARGDANEKGARNKYEEAKLKLMDMANKAKMGADTENFDDSAKAASQYAQYSNQGAGGGGGGSARVQAAQMQAEAEAKLSQLDAMLQDPNLAPQQRAQLEGERDKLYTFSQSLKAQTNPYAMKGDAELAKKTGEKLGDKFNMLSDQISNSDKMVTALEGIEKLPPSALGFLNNFEMLNELNIDTLPPEAQNIARNLQSANTFTVLQNAKAVAPVTKTDIDTISKMQPSMIRSQENLVFVRESEKRLRETYKARQAIYDAVKSKYGTRYTTGQIDAFIDDFLAPRISIFDKPETTVSALKDVPEVKKEVKSAVDYALSNLNQLGKYQGQTKGLDTEESPSPTVDSVRKALKNRKKTDE